LEGIDVTPRKAEFGVNRKGKGDLVHPWKRRYSLNVRTKEKEGLKTKIFLLPDNAVQKERGLQESDDTWRQEGPESTKQKEKPSLVSLVAGGVHDKKKKRCVMPQGSNGVLEQGEDRAEKRMNCT